MKPPPRRRRHLARWAILRRTTALLFLTLLVLGSFSWFPWFQGSTSASRVFAIVPFVDPLAALELALTTGEFTRDVWLGLVPILFAALLLGPVFCGYVCPLGLVLDLGQALRRRLRKKTWREAASGRPRLTRYLVLGLLLGLAHTSQLPVFQTLSPINLLARGFVFETWPLLLVGLSIPLGLLVLEWWWPRLWCRALCPLGALYSLLGWYSLLRVRVDPQLAGETPCMQCSLHCPVGISVSEQFCSPTAARREHADCSRCGACIDVCPRGMLGLSLRARTEAPGS